MISRYITLGELMKHFKAEIIAQTVSLLAVIEAMKKYEPNQLLDVCPQQHREEVHSLLVLIQPNLKDMGLHYSLREITRTLQVLDIPQTRNRTVAEAMTVILNRITDELESTLFFSIEDDKRHLIEENHLFGEEVAEKFSYAAFDIEEAGKCLAFERATACVFHLMRVMERGLRVLSASLNDPDLDPKRNPTWDGMLRKCRDELAKPLGKRSAEWKADDHFFSAATANLMAVKDAWRNPTMHVGKVYTEEQARDILNAVKGFMQQLATKLKEPSDGA